MHEHTRTHTYAHVHLYVIARLLQIFRLLSIFALALILVAFRVIYCHFTNTLTHKMKSLNVKLLPTRDLVDTHTHTHTEA